MTVDSLSAVAALISQGSRAAALFSLHACRQSVAKPFRVATFSPEYLDDESLLVSMKGALLSVCLLMCGLLLSSTGCNRHVSTQSIKAYWKTYSWFHNKPLTHQRFPANSWFSALKTNQFSNVPSNHVTLGYRVPPHTSLYWKPVRCPWGVQHWWHADISVPLLQVTSPVMMSFASFLSSRLYSPRSWGGGAYSSATTRVHAEAVLEAAS